MFDFHEKRKLRSIAYSKFTVLVLAVLVFFMAYTVWGVYEKERETRFKQAQRASVLDELEEREQDLASEIERLDSERGIEEEIRDKFEVARRGEGMIVIIDSPNLGTDTEDAEEGGIWRSISNFFDL